MAPLHGSAADGGLDKRKNWLFCWTEVGARYVGIAQCLIRTCRLQGVDPYTYLVDVLQRVATHPAAEVALLTPRLWKEHFAAHPMRSRRGFVPGRTCGHYVVN